MSDFNDNILQLLIDKNKQDINNLISNQLRSKYDFDEDMRREDFEDAFVAEELAGFDIDDNECISGRISESDVEEFNEFIKSMITDKSICDMITNPYLPNKMIIDTKENEGDLLFHSCFGYDILIKDGKDKIDLLAVPKS